ncbi:MAG: CDP-alcohol phosphatidyltransferase family protein [Candidatus Omnitrophica bacterium]|nr:CDP-alcohol phosphatidyltransferase family protein [Candidatus Omnitrophota bacterium]MDD5236711.1 CDP-alcohol phosphatidyltransferase family protein [Candidatus Omnitrophota bacterium]MDD5610976.1 CDP-alcohol phosphatidyltransferase family protein [Candidatus Omnitrophota bacterium]
MNIADKVSAFRILNVPFFIACIIYHTPERDYLRFIALAIFSLAAISDAVDGYIARKTKTRSSTGLILDPLADKILLISAFVLLSITKDFPQGIHFPLWVTLVVISRDIMILLGALVIFIARQKIDIHPSKWGKFTTAFQMAAVISVLLQWKFSYLFWSIAVLFTVTSGIDYIRNGLRLLNATDIPRNSP